MSWIAGLIGRLVPQAGDQFTAMIVVLRKVMIILPFLLGNVGWRFPMNKANLFFERKQLQFLVVFTPLSH